MKILLMNPPSLKGDIYMKELGRCGRKSVGGEIWPQTGLASIAAVIEQQGYEAKIIDSMAEGFGYKETLDAAKNFSPDIILLNTTTSTFKNDSEVTKMLKNDFGKQVYIGLSG